jgi:peptide/nickel transport system substrate-binding protein
MASAISVFGMVACASATPGAAIPGSGAEQAQRPSKTLVAIVGNEPSSMAQVPLLTEGASFAGLQTVQNFANANLLYKDDKLMVRPFLAEAPPKLNTDSWRVFSDGRMETTWKLRPNLVWQDGTALTSRDFVFAWQVYKVPDFGQSRMPLMLSIQDVSAPDDLTLLIKYRQIFQAADYNPLPPLPSHILETPFQQLDPLGFSSLSFWTVEYVGLGPYRVDVWEPGSFFEGGAFDKYVLGRPAIDRFRVRYVLDENSAIAFLRAGEAQFVGDSAIRLENALSLQDWADSTGGKILMRTSQYRAIGFQYRPEYSKTPALLDTRVKKALASTIDKKELNDTIFGGAMTPSDYLFSDDSEWGSVIAPSIVRYPYDARRAEQWMNDAGFVRGPDGFFTSSEGRFSATLETANAIDKPAVAMTSNWRRLGYDIGDHALAAALSTDAAARVLYPSMSIWTINQGEPSLKGFATSDCPRAENNWRSGSNRGCWSNPEFDRLYEAFNGTLDVKERGSDLAQMTRIYTEDLPMISVLFLAQPYEIAASLHGVLPVKPEGIILWNMHQWTLS